MHIVMFTNTYLPHVGGVAESVHRFADALEQLGHEVLIITPWIEGDHFDSPGVVRVPALEHVWDSDFSIPLPIPGFLNSRLASFAPDVVHSHHPFLLGDTALRTAAARGVPIVFTNHTQYDVYTHYLPWDSDLMRRFAIKLAVGYANLCDAVIAPSHSIEVQLRQNGVDRPTQVIPTGVDLAAYRQGDGARFRRDYGVSSEAFLVGHVGRLAPEKNLSFLANAVCNFLRQTPDARFFVAGEGPESKTIEVTARSHGCVDQLIHRGRLKQAELVDVYAALDLFTFSSLSETQGMVLVEAMATGTPVVALDAPGARDLIVDQVNGRLLSSQDPADFTRALLEYHALPKAQRKTYQAAAAQTAAAYDMPLCAEGLSNLYVDLVAAGPRNILHDVWHETARAIYQEIRILANVVGAGAQASWRE